MFRWIASAIAFVAELIGWGWSAMTGAWAFIENHADFPWLVVAGVALFLIAWVPYWMRRYLIEWPTKNEFERDFDDPKNADARDLFVFYAMQSYDDYCKTERAIFPQLRIDELADRAQPLDLPNNVSLKEWARAVPLQWDNKGLQWALRDFCDWVYSDPRSNIELKRQRRYVTKFWDRWGKQIVEGRLLMSDVQAQVNDNTSQIKLASYLEASHVLHQGWARGSGKSWLFKLARGKWKEPKWWHVWKRV